MGENVLFVGRCQDGLHPAVWLLLMYTVVYCHTQKNNNMRFFGHSYINKSEETALLLGAEEVP